MTILLNVVCDSIICYLNGKGFRTLDAGSSSYKLLDLDTSSLKLYWNMVQRFGGEAMWRRLLHVLRDVADKHGTGVANVATKWVMSQGGGGIAYPIIGQNPFLTLQGCHNPAAL